MLKIILEFEEPTILGFKLCKMFLKCDGKVEEIIPTLQLKVYTSSFEDKKLLLYHIIFWSKWECFILPYYHVVVVPKDRVRKKCHCNINSDINCMYHLFIQQSSYSILLAASTITKLVMRGSNSLSLDQRIDISKFIFNFY